LKGGESIGDRQRKLKSPHYISRGKERRTIMKYKKPEIVAENKAGGTFAAGCAESTSSWSCASCELRG
jgi:hypothetical protein